MPVLNEEKTQELYEICVKAIEFAEENSGGEDFDTQGDDRMIIALSPIIAALFAQGKYRYRAGPNSTLLVAATMIRNFAQIDGLSEVGLADAVQHFMHTMNDQADFPAPTED